MSFSKYDNVDVLHAVDRTATNNTTVRIFGLVMAQITTPTLASPTPLGLTPEHINGSSEFSGKLGIR